MQWHTWVCPEEVGSENGKPRKPQDTGRHEIVSIAKSGAGNMEIPGEGNNEPLREERRKGNAIREE